MTETTAREEPPAMRGGLLMRGLAGTVATVRGVLFRPWFWVPVGPLLAADLWTKHAVFAFLHDRYSGQFAREETWSYPVWSEEAFITFKLVAWRNTGTIWGLGRDITTPLVVLRCVALVLIVYFASRLPRRARGHQLVLGMILAGAVGNLYDNLTQADRGVRDFLRFATESVSWLNPFPAFNIADSCICVGAITLAILLWRDGSKAAPPAAGA